MVLAALGAIPALTARTARADGDAVTGANGCHPVADSIDDACHFVAQHHRLLHANRPKAAVMIVVQVGTTDAPCLDPDAHLVFPKRRHIARLDP